MINVDEEMKKLPKRNIVLYVSIVVILMCVTFRTSYAFYEAYVTNVKNPANTVVNSGALELKFAPGATYINATDMGITTAEQAATTNDNVSRFTITNSGTLTGKYKLYLSNYSISTNLVNEDFKWKLTIGENVYTGTFYELFNGRTPDLNNIISSSAVDIPITSTDNTLDANQSVNCEFRIWLQEGDHNQIGLTEGTFRTTIRLIAITN